MRARFFRATRQCTSRLSTITKTTTFTLAATVAAVDKMDDDRPSMDERISGNYFNRIREHSTPEKIFSTFASVTNEKGEAVMTWTDFREAILPYDFRSAAKKKPVQTPPAFLVELSNNLETQHSGDLTIAEFMFVSMLLAIPPHHFDMAFHMFDTDGNGEMSAKEFEALMEHFRLESTSEFNFFHVVRKSKLFSKFFGADGKTQMSRADFMEFLDGLRNAMLELEFNRYDSDELGVISSRAFAMALVSYAHHAQVGFHVARLNRMPEFGNVTMEEFKQFNSCLVHIDEITKALKLYSKCKNEISKPAFKRAVLAVTHESLPAHVIDIVFYVFDTNDDGALDYKELTNLLSRRFSYNQTEDRTFGFARFVGCFKQCFYETQISQMK